MPSTAGIAARAPFASRLETARRRGWLVPAALALAMAAATAFIYSRGPHLTFWVDEWGFMLHRRGHDLATFLQPQNGHLIAVPILVYKVLFKVFGVGSYVPYRVVAIAVELACAGLVFALVRRRVGDAVALAATVTVLFLGPAWETLIPPVGMVSLMSMAAGLGMLLALEAGTRRGDLVACVLLALSLASFSYGPAFAVAAAVDVLLRTRVQERIWIVAVPVGLYILWALVYGDSSQIVGSNLESLPRAIGDSLGADLAALTGLYRPSAVGGGPVFETTWAAPLALAFALLVAFRLRVAVSARAEPRLYALLSLALAFWVSLALVFNAGRTFASSRYIYPGAVMVLLVVAEMFRGRRLGPRGLVVVGAATILLLVVNVPNLRGAADPLSEIGRFDRAELAALDLARGVAPPTFSPEAVPGLAPGHYLGRVDAGSYYSAVDAFGSPAYSVAKLRHAPPGPRAAADQVLAAAIGGLAARPASAPPSGGCRLLAPGAAPSGQAVVDVSPGGLYVRGSQPGALTIRLRRFGSDFGPNAVGLTPLPGSTGVAIPIHRDAAPVPWRAQLSGIRAPVRICGLTAG